MNKFLSTALTLAALVLGTWACTRTMNPYSPGGGSSPQTITVTPMSSGISSTGYIYTSPSGTNASTGPLTITAHVGDTIIIPSSTGFHPLYFDAGTSTCIANGTSNSPLTYTFPSTGTYYFHCGNHGACTPGNGACGLTTCSAMAGVVSVM